MKKSLFISFVIFVFVLSMLPIASVVAQEQLLDVVYLKNGSIIRGMIIELIPNKSIKIKMVDNSLFVFQMDEIERMTKEPFPMQSPSSVPNFVSSPDKIIIGANPLGAILGGVTWISYERYFSENLTYQIRADLWTYSETENEGGYYYEENQIGFGAGSSVRAYLLSSQPYSGLFGAFGFDAVYTSWDWKERATTTSPMHTGDGNTMTVVLSAQFGFAIAISNVRIEPSIVAGNFILREKGAGVVGVFVAPAVQIGVRF